jgi:hypothetical protein
MRGYRERLRVPTSWWLIATACVLLCGTTLWAGLSLLIGAIIYVGLEAACALALLGWGAATIEVTEHYLKAGAQRLPLASIGGASALDAAQTNVLRGPRADPAAYMLLRPYLHTSVYVEVAGRPAERPYWLIATRRPAELAAAIDSARAADAACHADGGPVTRQVPDACDDSSRDRAAEPGQPTRPTSAGTAPNRREGDAC